MNKLLQENDEMQDEELYALLDRALETDRLCVSEDLIQRTLARVAEEQDSKVISFEKAAKRKIPAVKYIGVATAAVLVVFVGVRTLGNGKVSMDTAPMEAEAEYAGYVNKTEAADGTDSRGVAAADSRENGTGYYYSVTDSDAVTNHEAVGDMLADSMTPEESMEPEVSKSADDGECEGLLPGVTVTISAELTEALACVDAEPVSGKAEYWEFVQRETTWETELFYELAAAMDVFGESLPESGSYCYELSCSDGSSPTVYSKKPLDGIVRVETKKGTLWGLLGETVRFYAE